MLANFHKVNPHMLLPPTLRGKSTSSSPKAPHPSVPHPQDRNILPTSNIMYLFCSFLVFIETELWSMHFLCLTSLIQYFICKI